ncbi:MAG: helix-turn-helix domain-containing protein [Thermovirgaceae bacterium]
MKDREKILADLCEQARQRREAKGLSLEEISEATKIHKRFLEAIEAGDIDRLPGLVFSKGFIRNYLTHIGAEELYPEYESLMKTDAGTVQTESLVNYMPPQKGFQKTSRWWLYGILFAIIGISLFVIWQQRDDLAVQRENVPETGSVALSDDEFQEAEPDPTEPSVTGEETEKREQMSEDSEEPTETESPDVTVAVSPDEATAPVSPDSDMTWLPGSEEHEASFEKEEVSAERDLVIRASAPCWIRVTKNDDITYQGTLQDGDVREITVDAVTRIRYGNAGAVTHSWDGSDLGSVGGNGEVVTLEYHPDGSRNRL